MDKVIETIGLPAALEQTAEECAELTHACLKLARKIRGENYTPATYDILYEHVKEEMADVLVCIEKLIESNMVVSVEELDYIYESKSNRWEKRLESNMENKNL